LKTTLYVLFPQIAEVMLAQCKKKPIGDYKAVAIESAGDIIESLGVDVFGELFAILPITSPVRGWITIACRVKPLRAHLNQQ